MSHILRRTFNPSMGKKSSRVEFNNQKKPATQFTEAAWAGVVKQLDFSNQDDFDLAHNGFMARPTNFVIKAPDNTNIWDMDTFDNFIPRDPSPLQDIPRTVNPSLWRIAQLNMHYGLYNVLDGKIYQVRGFDLSNITFIVGKSGWIVLDPLISKECSAMALSLINYEVYTKFGNAAPKVSAVIYSHSHIDHYGGIMGVLGPNDVDDVKIYASKGFTEDAVSENVIAGNAMSRRALYMYGSLLEKDPQGLICAGLGMTTSMGENGFVKPTNIISQDYQTEEVDGIEMEFQFTPGTEAPTEMNTWIADWNALWMAENSTNTMHNLLTLRGAQVRDALVWANYLTNTINRYGKQATVKFQSHHWPIWGNDKIVKYLKRQRAIYQYTHDQSVRYMNKGYIGEEIADMMKLPPLLNQEWSTRGYYGTLSHNSHAVYQRYMGWYSGNPSDLNKLPQEEAAKKYVEYMGTESEIVDKAYEDYQKGQYRWVAEVLRHVVFNNPNYDDAKYLLADAYEQLGYQAESGAWRGCYLQGAQELRHGKPPIGISTISEEVVRNMTPMMLFNFWGVHVNPESINFEELTVNVHLTDMDVQNTLIPQRKEPNWYALTVEYGCLVVSPEAADGANATITTVTNKLFDLFLGEGMETWLNDPAVQIPNNEKDAVKQLFSVFDMKDEMMFNIVTP